MGRRNMEIEKIHDTNKRIVTFSKRRSGLMSKATELCKLWVDIIVCIILFSPAGKAYTFDNCTLGVCNVVERFLEEQTKDKKQKNKNVHRFKNSTQYRNKNGVGSGIMIDTFYFWWDNIDVEELDSVEKLKSVREALASLKQNLFARKEELAAVSLSPMSSPSSTIEDSIIEDRIVLDTSTIITEKHEAIKNCSKVHPNLDLSLNVGWQSDKNETMSLCPLLKRDCRHLVEPCQSHSLTELTLKYFELAVFI
ncbi:hypothetical protein MKX01_001170 [Papaver californicum]|nr:hypothetical protein MKX01_001170 [Papaver californicum]